MEWMEVVKIHASLCSDRDKLTVREPWAPSLRVLTDGRGRVGQKCGGHVFASPWSTWLGPSGMVHLVTAWCSLSHSFSPGRCIAESDRGSHALGTQEPGVCQVSENLRLPSRELPGLLVHQLFAKCTGPEQQGCVQRSGQTLVIRLHLLYKWVLLLRTSAALVFLSCLHSHSHDLVSSFVRTCPGSILHILEGICIKTNSSYTNNLLLYNSFPLTKACSVVIPSGSHNSLMSETGVFSIPPKGNLWNNWFKVNRGYNPGHLRSDLVLFLL